MLSGFAAVACRTLVKLPCPATTRTCPPAPSAPLVEHGWGERIAGRGQEGVQTVPFAERREWLALGWDAELEYRVLSWQDDPELRGTLATVLCSRPPKHGDTIWFWWRGRRANAEILQVHDLGARRLYVDTGNGLYAPPRDRVMSGPR